MKIFSVRAEVIQCVSGWGFFTYDTHPITNEHGTKVTVGVAAPPYPPADIRFKCWIASDSPYPEAKVDCSNTVIPKGDVIDNPLKNITHTYYFDVTGLPDDIDDGTQMYYLMVQAVSDSATYNNVIHAPNAMMNMNVDKAGVVFKADKNLQLACRYPATIINFRPKLPRQKSVSF